jgi:hypothetical protein
MYQTFNTCLDSQKKTRGWKLQDETNTSWQIWVQNEINLHKPRKKITPCKLEAKHAWTNYAQ